MRDAPRIYLGLAVFLGLITFPIWHNLGAGTTSKGPEPKLPVNVKQCVAPTAYMRTSHMDLLLQWRDRAVRYQDRNYKSADGKVYAASLTNTCLNECHTSKKDFCDRCHNYAAVSVYCWDCHIDPQQPGTALGVPSEARGRPRLSPAVTPGAGEQSGTALGVPSEARGRPGLSPAPSEARGRPGLSPLPAHQLARNVQ